MPNHLISLIGKSESQLFDVCRPQEWRRKSREEDDDVDDHLIQEKHNFS